MTLEFLALTLVLDIVVLICVAFPLIAFIFNPLYADSTKERVLFMIADVIIILGVFVVVNIGLSRLPQ